MKNVQILLIALLLCVTSSSAFAVGNQDQQPTAESVFELAKGLTNDDQHLIKQAFEQLSASEKSKLIQLAVDDAKAAEALGAADTSVGMYILAIIIPPLAVGLHTDWAMPTVWNLLFTILGWLPGVVHAFYILSTY